MTFEVALKYVRENNIKATYIHNNSTISISAARRMINGDTTPHEDTKLALIEFVKSHIQSYNLENEEDFLDRVEEMVDENFEKLMQRKSFRRIIHIEALKIFIKAQAKGDTINVENLSEAIKDN